METKASTMAKSTEPTANSLDGFTDPLSHSPFMYASGYFSRPHRYTPGEIARLEQIALNGRTRTPSTTDNTSDLLEGSTAEDKDQNRFDPTLGPTGSGRPKPSIPPKDSGKVPRPYNNYSWGDTSNLRADE